MPSIESASSEVVSLEAPELPVTFRTTKDRALLGLVFSFFLIVLLLDNMTTGNPMRGIAAYGSTGRALNLIFYSILLIPLGYMGLISIFRLFCKKVLFTANEQGILLYGDNKRLIEWSEIVEFRVMYMGGTANTVGVFLKNVDAYYATLGMVAMQVASFLNNTYGTPVVLQCYDVKLETLTAWLNQYRAKYSFR